MQQMIFIADFIVCSTCFGAPLCPSSGAREYYTDGRCLWYLVHDNSKYTNTMIDDNVASARNPCPIEIFESCHLSSCLCILSYHAPNITGSDHLYNTLELLMMGIMVPETY